MSDHQSFLNAILANPDDDTPRLIYADWLEEQGDAPRGEFIRVQCELAKTSPDQLPDPDLARRQTELRGQHEQEWLRDIRKWFFKYTWGRGFLETVVVYPSQFTLRGEALCQRQPVRVVRILKAREKIGAILATGTLQHVPTVETLDLHENSLEGQEVGKLLQSPQLAALKHLLLRENLITDQGVQPLLNLPHADDLQTIDLRNNYLSERMCRQLLERFGDRILLEYQLSEQDIPWWRRRVFRGGN